MIRLLYGENSFALLQKKQSLIDDYLKNDDVIGLERIDAEETSEAALRSAVLQLPFLADKKLVVITSLFQNKNLMELFGGLIDLVPPEVDVVIVDEKADKRTKLFKTLAAQKAAEEFPTLKGAQLSKWAIDYARKHGAALDVATADKLLGKIGPHQEQLAREIEKLSVHTTITQEIIEENTHQNMESTIFELLEATFNGKKENAMHIIESLYANNTDPNEIMALIAWQLHLISLAVANPGSSNADLASRYKIHPFVAGKALSISQSITRSRLIAILDLATMADKKIKTSSGDSKDVLRVLILELTSLF